MKKMIVGGLAAFAAALGIAAAGCGRCCPAKCPTSRRIPAVSNELIGCVGSVMTATRGAAVLGEVMLAVAGHQQACLAWSAEPLDRGERVVVIRTRGLRTVEVEPWNDLGMTLWG
jgi:hypothetical protein